MSICELLPWFAAGNLDESEHVTVVLHLGTCAPCRRELVFWHNLGASLQAEVDCLPGKLFPPPSLSGTLQHQLLHALLQIVPVYIPIVTVCAAEVLYESPAGTTSIVKLSVPILQNQNIADWLLAIAGN